MKEKNKLGFKFVSAKNGNKTLIFDDGTKLTGNFSKWESYVVKVGVEIDVKSNFPNYGTYEYTDGLTYEGELKNGVHHGLGKMIFPDGRFFYGEFKDNELVKELRDEKEKENFKKIIKIFKPKKNNDGTYSFTNPGEKQINLIKKDIFLFDLIRSILTDNVDMKWQSMVDGSSEILSGKGALDKLFKKYKI